ncbi:MAG: UDP-N-acetylglucosamine 2-epimerase (non-hydrolyzing) [Ignavibacteriales bacterium]|nr:UDP-N-acetylglucosamine 2-epimerase (non-hydrolyzing) [Ignavibacteriales bacterium]
MKTLLIVAGTRPEIIKTIPVVIEARKRKDIKVVYCLTGQHKTMAMEALSIFGVQPDDDLQIMRPNQTLNMICESVFAKLPPVIEKVKPDIVMVQGDTTTAAMTAICAFNMKVQVAHIEAGLRTFNMDAPYPEECNRRLISVVSMYNLCPTEDSRLNLEREGAKDSTLYVIGNTVVDALRLIQEKHDLNKLETISPDIKKPFALITAHRRESFGGGFQNICTAIRECAIRYPQFYFIYPVHLNPNVKGPVHELLGDIPNVKLIAPIPYLELLTLMKHCEFVLTDSGGIQEEAPSFGKHCIVMREVTERMESVNLGMSELVGTDVAKILGAIQRTVEGNIKHDLVKNPYGDGHASEKILDILTHHTTTIS